MFLSYRFSGEKTSRFATPFFRHFDKSQPQVKQISVASRQQSPISSCQWIAPEAEREMVLPKLLAAGRLR
ncbi:MAG: hypothetical protein L6461_06735 [Anaerolineae bacterium]|nr:hypothetical protein [Anaerolineae bacterium]